jgi:8-oxo-dGTP diphosphatase
VTASSTEIITRIVATDHDRVLLARQRNKRWYFLPGGHVEPGEHIHAALLRELAEELDITPTAPANLIGIVEHEYTDDTEHHELNLVFEVGLPTNEVTSREDHLEFTWHDLTELVHLDLRPSQLKDAILNWTQTGEMFWRGLS